MAVLVFELTAGVFFKFAPAPEHVYQYSYLTGYNYDAYVAFKSHNFPAYGAQKDINSKSLVILGGSTAVGVGSVDPEKRYFVKMQNFFKKNTEYGFNNIVNYAVPGYVSNQESITYKNFVFPNPSSPKLVVSLTTFNDLYFYLFRSLDVGDHEFSYAMDYIFKKGYPDPTNKNEKIRNAVRRTNIYSVIHYLTQKQPDGSVPPIRISSDFQDPRQRRMGHASDDLVQATAEHFLTNVLSTALLTKSKGTKYLVILQPNYLYGGELTLENNEWFDNMPALQKWIEEIEFQKPAYDRFYQIVISRLQKYKNQGLLDYLDYRDLLKNSGPAFADPVHFNDLGAKFFAEQLLRDINTKVLINKKFNGKYEI